MSQENKQWRSRQVAEARATPIPETIHTSLGARIPTQTIVNKAYGYQVHNLRTGRVSEPGKARLGRAKYTWEDRLWQSQASAQEIAVKLNISYEQARTLKWQASKHLETLKKTS